MLVHNFLIAACSAELQQEGSVCSVGGESRLGFKDINFTTLQIACMQNSAIGYIVFACACVRVCVCVCA